MKTLSIKAKLINCFFALTLVTGLCVPSLANYAYAEPEEEIQNAVAIEELNENINQSANEFSDQLSTKTSNQETKSSNDQLNKQDEPELDNQTQAEATTFTDELTVTPQSAALTVETRGTSSTAQVSTAIGETVGGQNGFISMVGPYQFNATGNSNVRGKYTSIVGQAVHSSHVAALVGKSAGVDADKEVSGYSLAAMKAGTATVHVGGKVTGGAGATGYSSTNEITNSSSAELVPSRTNGSNNKIVKAYLVIACSQGEGFQNATTPLSNYGVSFIAPDADKVYRLYPEVVYRDGYKQRYSCFFDVTDIVQKQANGGYGWYSVLNIPLTCMTDNNVANVGTDYFGSWRLAVVEENTELEPRMLRLKLGGVPVTFDGAAKVSIEGDGLSVKNNPTGQLIASMDGSDCDSPVDNPSTQYISYTTTTGSATSGTKIVTNSATNRAKNNKYFRLRIDNRDLLKDGESFDPVPIDASQANYSYLAAADNKKIHNTDLVVQDINDGKGGMELKGGENQVNMTVSTSNAPTILSVLGLTLDIVAPKFETTLKIANLCHNVK